MPTIEESERHGRPASLFWPWFASNISVAGKRGSAPTPVLRAAFGVNGNRVPSAISRILTVGWETVLVVLATLGTSTVFARLGWSHGDATKSIVHLVVAGMTVTAGVFGFALIMRLQTWITLATSVLTVGYIALTMHRVNWGTSRWVMPAGWNCAGCPPTVVCSRQHWRWLTLAAMALYEPLITVV